MADIHHHIGKNFYILLLGCNIHKRYCCILDFICQLRGYLEINEKQLDKALENDLDQIKNIFGYDSDGDLIVDTGIAYQLDRQLGSWVQSGGIIANKNATLKTRIKSSETKIATLERQIDNKEAQLRSKYGQMEGTLNSLNAQSNTISNFANNGKQ